MDIALTDIPQKEVWHYLGHKGQADPHTTALVEECSSQLLKIVRPKALWRELAISISADGVLVEESGLYLPGRDLAKHLAGCSVAIALVATMGVQVDTFIRRYQIEDLARAVVMDSCATAAIEEVCNRIEELIMAILPGKYFTSRFSPGYGDLPLTIQGDLLVLLDAPCRIGLCVTSANILTPCKSVTALIGVSDIPIQRGQRSCQSCTIKNTCQFRTRGEHCGL